MNTKLNLWQDKKILNKLKHEDITEERIAKQSKKCEEKFEIWERCIRTKSWNDEQCIGKLKPNYEMCIVKRNMMQTIFDNRLDEDM